MSRSLFTPMKHFVQAVADAFDGGWEYRGITAKNIASIDVGSMDDDLMIRSMSNYYVVQFERILLDVGFWAGLGQKRAWPEVEVAVAEYKDENDVMRGTKKIPAFVFRMHDFVDSRIANEGVEGYFEKLK